MNDIRKDHQQKVINGRVRVLFLLLFAITIGGIVILSPSHKKVQEDEGEGDPQFQALAFSSFSSIREAFATWLTPNGQLNDLHVNYSMDGPILNLSNFTFYLHNDSRCQGEIFLVILIHSAVGHFLERDLIRTTWGSLSMVKTRQVRLAFLLGNVHMRSNDLTQRILQESMDYGDLVSSEDFQDTYKNLTYKHLMGYKFIHDFCPNTSFVLKADEDAFIDLFQLVGLLALTQASSIGGSARNMLVCSYPQVGTSIKRVKGSKWQVSLGEYPFKTYPKYCIGKSYIVTPDVVTKVLAQSQGLQKFFWIDDVFVTGVLVEFAGISPIRNLPGLTSTPYINLITGWLNEPVARKSPFIFMSIGARNASMKFKLIRDLWNKTRRIFLPD